MGYYDRLIMEGFAMIKRILTMMLAVCICVNCVAFATAAPEINIDNVTAAPGENITVAVSVKGNPGFAAMVAELVYDSETLVPVSATGGTVLNGAGIVSNVQQGGDMKNYNPITLFVVSPSDFTGDGSVFLVTFTVKDTAKAGKTEISLSYGDEAIANQKYEDVKFKINQGSVTVTGGASVAVGDGDKPATSESTKEEAKPQTQPQNTYKKDITITIDGEEITFDQPPIIVGGRTLVPMRAIFEALGAIVDWENDTRTAVGTKDGTTVRFQIDNNIMKKNGEDILLDVPAQLVNSRTLVPIRAVSESFGCKVDWINDTRTVVILTK